MTQRDLSEWAPFLSACKQLTLVHSQSVATNDLQGLHMKGIGMRGKKMALLECKGGIIFPLQDLMGKQLFISAKKKPFSAGHSRGDGNLERRRISEYVSFRTVRTRWMPH